MKKKLTYVITDLQFGSCGKGLLAGYMARKLEVDTVVTAWAPNAGHTFIDTTGRKWVHCMLANGCVIPTVKRVLIGPGSVIDAPGLLKELQECGRSDFELAIHPNAAVVSASHREAEAAYAHKIGSTMKGSGEALIQKIRREPENQNVASVALKDTDLGKFLVTTSEYNDMMDQSDVLLAEGAQGFSLGINNGFYPYTTSRECTTSQVMSDCAIPFNRDVISWGVCRTFPIRVNNRAHTSGPYYDDQEEISWDDVGVAPELTTVTKLPRRVFTFSIEQVKQATRMNGTSHIFLNFCNYLGEEKTEELAQRIEEATGVRVDYTGWGPAEGDIRVR